MPTTYASEIFTILNETTFAIAKATVIVFMLAVLVFGWGIVKLIASADNPEKLKQAKGIIWWGIIGMFILASIGGIIFFLQSELLIQTIQVIKPPQF